MKLVIDRSRWLRGEGGGNSWLLRPGDGKMCCLGMLAKQLGASDEDIRGYRLPRELDGVFWPKKLTDYRIAKLMQSNDVRLSKGAEPIRERDIVKYFSESGIEVEFVDCEP